MASELPRPAWTYGDDTPPWKSDPELRKDRHILVPDTIEWAGKKPWADEHRHAPVEFVTPSGWAIRMPCFDRPRGRLIGTSSCTGLETPVMPFADHAWQFMELAEAMADEYLSHGWQISRVDFARDLRVPDSIEFLKEAGRSSTRSGYQVEVHLKERQLGVTYLGAADGDRLRIYHKGLETTKKFGFPRMPATLADVIRVELQLRKGQLDDRVRTDVRALQTVRVKPEPTEADIPVMRTKPARGQGIRRRHLHCMNRDRRPQRAIEATEAVDRFLIEQQLDRLIPGAFGTELPEPRYGEAPAHAASGRR